LIYKPAASAQAQEWYNYFLAREHFLDNRQLIAEGCDVGTQGALEMADLTFEVIADIDHDRSRLGECRVKLRCGQMPADM
jgi:hypothetical protein